MLRVCYMHACVHSFSSDSLFSSVDLSSITVRQGKTSISKCIPRLMFAQAACRASEEFQRFAVAPKVRCDALGIYIIILLFLLLFLLL